MDLNGPPGTPVPDPPGTPVPELRSSILFKVIVKTKLECRAPLVSKFGEDGYETILASSEPLILLGLPSNMICIFVII